LRDRAVVGIITETDIFKALIEMMGAREEGVRLTIRVHDEPGTLSRIAGAIAAVGGDIISLGTFYSDERRHGLLVVKVCCVEDRVLEEALRNIGAEILDVRSA
jgi:acetoin utilization protein AcuB